MLSRVAESIYWLARYIERAENTARLVNANTNLLLDLPGGKNLGWHPLLTIMGSEELFNEHYDEANESAVVRFLIADTRNTASLLGSLQLARESARTIRDIIPREGWETINALYLEARAQLPAGLSRRRRYNFLGSVIKGAQQLTGLLAGTMTHDYGYDFLRIGRNLERADMTTRIIDIRLADIMHEESTLPDSYKHIQWMSVLNSLSGYQSYRQIIQSPVTRGDVLRFLLQEASFPRTVLHCIEQIKIALDHVPSNDELITAIVQLCIAIDETNPAEMSNLEVHQLIDDIQLELANLNDTITATYFQHHMSIGDL